jgi:hypothetical protein
MIDRPPNPERWFQFRLRTLLAFTAICAVACWAVIDGVPWFQEYRRRAQFESVACQLKAGDTSDSIRYKLYPPTSISGSLGDDPQGNAIEITRYNFKTATYFIVQRASGSWHRSTGIHFTRIEVFRVAPEPKNYKPHAPEASARLENAGPSTAWQDPGMFYHNDFAEYAGGDRKDNFGLTLELIHSDSLPAVATPAHE